MAGRRFAALGFLCVAALAVAACSPAKSGGGSPPDATSHALQVTRSGSGTVTSSPAGISCGSTCSATFAAGTTVTLTAVAAANYDFSGWTGAGISCPGTGTCSVPMTEARSVTATFSPSGASSYALTVSKTGSGTVTSSPAGISCGSTCSATFAAGTTVTLTAVAAANYDFSGWTGSGISCAGTGTCSVPMTAARSVIATFSPSAPATYTLTVSKAGSGTVTSAPAGISCGSTCSAAFAAGASVTLTAAASGGFTFAGWSGTGISCPGTGPCAISMTAARAVLARFISSDPTDLCNGLVTDKLAHPMTAMAKPAVRQGFIDPQFGTTIRRVSDALAYGAKVAKPMYSTIQAWNADESYLILYHTDGAAGHHLYDGRTYAHIKELDIQPADLEQVYWDTSDPKILYYTDSATRRLHRFNVDTDTHATSTVVRDFSLAPVSCTGSLTGGVDPMWTSWDSSSFGYACGSKVFTYRKDTNTVGTVATISAGGAAPQPSPSGTLFYFNRNNVAQVYDPNMTLLRTLSGIEGNSHASLGTSDGNDTLFSVQFDGVAVGMLVASDLATGAHRVIVGESTGYPYPPTGTHVSAVAYRRPGWVAVDGVGDADGAGVLDQEVLLVNANSGGKVCRVAHHRSCGNGGQCGSQGYWAEPHNTISPSGTRILFGSDWGGGATVDTYVVELPSYTRP